MTAPPTPRDDNRMLELLDALRESDLSPAGATELRDRVTRNPEDARLYLHYVQLWAELRWLHGDSADIPAPGAPDVRRTAAAPAHLPNRWARVAFRLTAAAAIVLAITASIAVLVQQSARRAHADRTPVATLIDTRSAVWGDSDVPTAVGVPLPGGFLRLRSGVAQVEFLSGAQVTLTGPCEFGLNSPMRGVLRRGRVAAYVPPRAHGFTVSAPGCAVVDLGTRYTLHTDAQGRSTLAVQQGRVEVYSTAGPAGRLRVTADHVLSVAPTGELGTVHRAPRPSPELTLDFRKICGTLADRSGRRTGFTTRLPETGSHIAENDPNLDLRTDAGLLTIRASETDLNGQVGVDSAECPGIRLSDLGFTGDQDFTATATFTLPRDMRKISQFGLYVGVSGTQATRAGVIASPVAVFAANTVGRSDFQQVFKKPGRTGPDGTVTVTIRRTDGAWSLKVGDVDVTPAEMAFLNMSPDLVVGVFAHHGRGASFEVQLRRFSVAILDEPRAGLGSTAAFAPRFPTRF